jgi:hypothetical protein
MQLLRSKIALKKYVTLLATNCIDLGITSLFPVPTTSR